VAAESLELLVLLEKPIVLKPVYWLLEKICCF
jgi:hypothetical protein